MTDHAAVIREASMPSKFGTTPTLAALAALEADLAEAHLSLETYKSALSGTQHVRDAYKARAQAAEARVKSIEAYLMEPPEKLRERAEAAEAERDEFGSDRLSLQQQISELVRTARSEQVRAEAAEAELASSEAQVDGAELRCMAAKADNARLRDALDWIEAEPENPTVVQERAREALAATEDTP